MPTNSKGSSLYFGEALMTLDSAARSAVYSPIAKFLHWSIVALLVAQWWLAEKAEEAVRQIDGLGLLALHKSFGITILLLVVIRLAVRLLSPPPASPVVGLQAAASLAVHRLFYCLLIFMPLTGWLGSSASAYSVSWFGWWVLPDLVAANEVLKDRLFALHEWSWTLLCALVVVHVAAALWHQFIGKHRVLFRMLSPFGVAVFCLSGIIVAAVVQRSGVLGVDESELYNAKAEVMQSSSTESSGSLRAENAIEGWLNLKMSHAANLEAWDIDYSRSEITFVAEQAGAAFEGRFRVWKTEIYLSPGSADEQGLIRAVIDLSSVDTKDQERDGTLQEESFFSTALFPQATFLAYEFSAEKNRDDEVSSASLNGSDFSKVTSPTNLLLEGGLDKVIYRGVSSLQLKGRRQPIQFEFTLQNLGSEYELLGYASLDRLALFIGTGEWLDTEWIGQIVEVSVRVIGRVPEEAGRTATQR